MQNIVVNVIVGNSKITLNCYTYFLLRVLFLINNVFFQYQQIQLDYRATLDEKEELVSDRDYYKNKVQRLSHQISYILSNRAKLQDTNDIDPPKPIVDIDALVTENKYLHERITQLQVEKEILKRTLTKYKVYTMLLVLFVRFYEYNVQEVTIDKHVNFIDFSDTA